VELQAKRMPCSWETEEEMVAGENLMESKQVKMGLVLVVDDNLERH
jgi:hypothetical protein